MPLSSLVSLTDCDVLNARCTVHVWLCHKGAFGCESPIVPRLLLFLLYVKSRQAMVAELLEEDVKKDEEKAERIKTGQMSKEFGENKDRCTGLSADKMAASPPLYLLQCAKEPNAPKEPNAQKRARVQRKPARECSTETKPDRAFIIL